MIHLFRKLWAYARRNGWAETLGLIVRNIAHHARWYLDKRFDRLHGTDTADRIELDTLETVGGNKSEGVYYEPTPTALFRHIMNRVGADINVRDFVFLDYGSGKGRTLLLASDYPFKGIAGIEFSRELHAIAQANIEKYQGRRQCCRTIEAVLADAAAFDPPHENLLIYFYNPFSPTIMQAALARLRAVLAHSRAQAVLVYYNPLSADVVEASGIFCKRLEIDLPYDITRVVQRKCHVFFNTETAPGQPLAGLLR